MRVRADSSILNNGSSRRSKGWTAVAVAVTLLAAGVGIEAVVRRDSGLRPIGRAIDPPALRSTATPLAAAVAAGDMSTPPGTAVGAQANRPGTSTPTLVQRTATANVFDDHDGTLRAVVDSRPVNRPDGQGGWVPISSGGTPDGSGWTRFELGAASASLPARTGGDLLRMGGQGWSLAVRADFPVESRVAARKAGPGTWYDEVAPGISLGWDVGASSVASVIRIDQAAAQGRAAWRFGFSYQGVEPLTDADGHLSFRDPAGATVLNLPDGMAAEAVASPADEAPRTPTTVRVVDRAKDHVTVEEAVDQAWLYDPIRRYPIFVDPDYVLDTKTGGSQDAYVESNCGNCNYDGDRQIDARLADGTPIYTDKVGIRTISGIRHEYYSYLHYDIPNLGAGHPVVTGNWSGDFWDTDPRPSNFSMYRVTDPWNAGTVGWSNKPTHAGDRLQAAANGPGWVNYDITTWVSGWASGALPNYGISLDTTGNPGYLRLAASESSFMETEHHVVVRYRNGAPPVPDRATASPADGISSLTSTPTLSIAPTTDPDGDPVRYWFRVGTSNGAETGQVLNTGWISTPSFAVPEGILQDGVSYYWKVFATDPYSEQTVNSSWPANRLRSDLRLGGQGSTPTAPVGPVSVDLATGNLHTAVTGPTFATVGGPVGVGFSYNSRAPADGLRAAYYDKCAIDAMPAEPTVVGTDPNIDHDWGTGSPKPGFVGADNVCVEWTGYLTIPNSNLWCFAFEHDDNVLLWVNGQLVEAQSGNGGPDLSFGYRSGADRDAYGPHCLDMVDHTATIRVRYAEVGGSAKLRMYAKEAISDWAVVPPAWLSGTPRSVPRGWTFSAGQSEQLAYLSADVTGAGVTLREPDGGATEFRTTGSGGFAAPPGNQDVLTRGVDGNVTVQATDGTTYSFNERGRLTRVETAADPAHPASVAYDYVTGQDGDTGRVASLRDPVSGRTISLTYSAPNGGRPGCPPWPSQYAQPPAGMLCQVSYPDRTETVLRYYADGQLARIEDPGGVKTDFGYTGGRLTSLRTPLANDAIGARLRADDTSAETDIAYTGDWVSDVTLPAPAAAAARPTQHVRRPGPTTTDLLVDGLSMPGGYARRVTFDPGGRSLTDTDASGVTSTTRWAVSDLLLATESRGARTTYAYDGADRTTDVWGPAATSCFGSDDRPNGSCANPRVAHSTTQHDGNMHGLAARYWSNPSFAGPAVAVATGIGTLDGSLHMDWGSGSPAGVPADNWSARYTGYVTLPSGTTTLQVCGDDYVRLVVDDVVIGDKFTGGPGCTGGPVTVGGPSTKRIRVDFAELGGGANVNLYWVPPTGGPPGVVVPGSALSPGYGLVTRTQVDEDQGVPAQVTATEYDRPELGLANRTITDPDGLRLVTASSYEPEGTGWFRPTSKTLPAGPATTVTYAHYAPSDAPKTLCDLGGFPQGGLPRSTTSAPAADGTRIVREQVHDAVGRITASRVGTEPWTCTTYDARGRTVSRTVPAYGTQQAKTYSWNYAVDGNPLVSSASVTGSGTVTTTVDLLGRTSQYQDAWGTTTTTTYDLAGRPTDTNGPAGARHTTYDTRNLVGEVRLDGQVMAVPGYDPDARLTSVTYPTGGGNGTTGTTTPDRQGRTTDLRWAKGTTALSADHVAYSQGGHVIDQTVDGVDSAPTGPNFGYDTAGRLTSASVAGHGFGYTFNSTGGCGPLTTAGADTNRTAKVVDGTTTTYCHDAADRLVSTTDAEVGAIAYDAHGNTTTLGRQTLGYDAEDQHLTTRLGPSVAVAYQRDASGRIIQRTGTQPAPIEIVGSMSARATGSSISLTAPAVGTWILAQVAITGPGPLNTPSGWTLLRLTSQSSTLQVALYGRRRAAPDPPTTTSFSYGGTSAVGSIVAFDGVNAVDTTGTGGTGSTLSTLSPTDTVRDGIVVAAFATSADTAITPSAGTIRAISPTGGPGATVIADLAVDQSGQAPAPMATATAAGPWTAQLIVLKSRITTSVTRYGYQDAGDAAAVVMDGSGTITDRLLSLPGGVLVSKRGTPTNDRWSYSDIHGDIVRYTDGNGQTIGDSIAYDADGNTLTGGEPRDLSGGFDDGWLGQHQRQTEHAGTSADKLATVEMGARQYVPRLGRFIEVDPVEGGSANDYDYVGGEPIEGRDLAGTMLKCGSKQLWISVSPMQQCIERPSGWNRWSGRKRFLWMQKNVYGKARGGMTFGDISSSLAASTKSCVVGGTMMFLTPTPVTPYTPLMKLGQFTGGCVATNVFGA